MCQAYLIQCKHNWKSTPMWVIVMRALKWLWILLHWYKKTPSSINPCYGFGQVKVAPGPMDHCSHPLGYLAPALTMRLKYFWTMFGLMFWVDHLTRPSLEITIIMEIGLELSWHASSVFPIQDRMKLEGKPDGGIHMHLLFVSFMMIELMEFEDTATVTLPGNCCRFAR